MVVEFEFGPVGDALDEAPAEALAEGEFELPPRVAEMLHDDRARATAAAIEGTAASRMARRADFAGISAAGEGTAASRMARRAALMRRGGRLPSVSPDTRGFLSADERKYFPLNDDRAAQNVPRA